MPAIRSCQSRWFGPVSIFVAWLALIVTFIHPPHGTGVQICYMQAMAGMPCPGCGITRSMSSAVHGMFAESWSYHPFGVPILLLFIATAGLSILPRTLRQRVAAKVFHNSKATNIVYIVFVTAFVTFGVARSVLYLIYPIA
ncbi:MAG: DUF2752 domain-containing protein [Planctomycetes bacterium]|nr:DUF2752 domain-containing protein [Planctomycetota bacterium]